MPNANSSLGDLKGLITKSSLVFRGELQEVSDSNTMKPLLSNGSNKKIMLAKVEDIIHAPENIQVGNNIILQLSDADIQTGSQKIFFALPQFYGETIVAKETGRTESENETNVRKQVNDTLQELADKDLMNKINQSMTVIVGEISDISELDKGEFESHEEDSELLNVDDPIYGKATISVFEVLKGNSLEMSDVSILYNTNTDHVLEQKPIYKLGDQGIFFLQESRVTGPKEIKFSTLENGDFQPINPKDRHTIIAKIKSLVNPLGSSSQTVGANL